MSNNNNAMNSRAHVRLARPDDYEAVMALNRFLYDGSDYLPVMYHVFLQDKRADCFVMEVDGKVVGYKLNRQSADGQRLVSIAARIHGDYQERGFAGLMSRESLRLSLVQRPSVVKTTYCTQYFPFIREAVEKRTEFGGQVAWMWNNTFYFVNREQLGRAVGGFKQSLPGNISCHRGSSSEYIELLKNNQQISSFFPTGIMPCGGHWYPTKITDDKDVKELLANSTLFISKSADGEKVLGLGTLECKFNKKFAVAAFYIWCLVAEAFRPTFVEMLSHAVKVTQPGVTVICVINSSGVDIDDVREFLASQLGSNYGSDTLVNLGGCIIETPIGAIKLASNL